VGEITVSVVGSKNPNWFDTHQIPKNAAYAIPDEAATRLMTASLDVTDPTAATRVVSDAVDHFGRIDVLVNNAGYASLTAFEEMSPEQIHQQFATNVYGVMNVTRAVLPVMRRQRSGHLFTIASMGGYLGGSRGTAYAASKFAVAGFTESLALELEEFGITATIVGPGYFRTDFLDKSSAILEPATLIEDYRASNVRFAPPRRPPTMPNKAIRTLSAACLLKSQRRENRHFTCRSAPTPSSLSSSITTPC